MSWWQPLLSLALLLAGIIMNATGVEWFQNRWVQLAWYAVAWLPTGWGVLREAIEEAREGEIFSEFLLMSIASIGAFAIGEYPEAVAVMTLYCIGEALQDRAVSRARGNIKSLIAFRPDHAVVIKDNKRETVEPGMVKPGDIIEVKPGERVPVDAILTGEAAAFDTAALTGESVPRVIESGDEVLAGMIASESVVRLKALRPASESAVSRILHLVEEATERKAPAELFIRRFALFVAHGFLLIGNLFHLTTHATLNHSPLCRFTQLVQLFLECISAFPLVLVQIAQGCCYSHEEQQHGSRNDDDVIPFHVAMEP